jgi:dihydroorotase
VDHKIVEFEYAQFGMTGLETSFALVRSCLPGLDLEKIISLFSIQPRRIFDLPAATIELQQPAVLTLFLPDEKWIVNDLYSRSGNTPLLGKELTGKPVGIINKDKLFLK